MVAKMEKLLPEHGLSQYRISQIGFITERDLKGLTESDDPCTKLIFDPISGAYKRVPC